MSQYNEEEIILRYLKHIKKGVYVDIGAADPIKNSNTYFLYEKGWSGLLIEPCPTFLCDLIEKRPKDKLLPIAVMDHDGTIPMDGWCVHGSWLFDRHKEEGKEQQNYQVQCLKIPTIIEKYPQYKKPDFLSVDVETNEDNVLKAVDFNVFKPTLICMEYIVRGIDQRHRWEKMLLHFYMQVDVTPGNAFYLRKDMYGVL